MKKAHFNKIVPLSIFWMLCFLFSNIVSLLAEKGEKAALVSCNALVCNDHVRAAINPGCSGYISIDGILESPCFGAGVSYDIETVVAKNKLIKTTIDATNYSALSDGLNIDGDNFSCNKIYELKITRYVNGSSSSCNGNVTFQDITPPVINVTTQTITSCAGISDEDILKQLKYSVTDYCEATITGISVGSFPSYFCNGTPKIPITIYAEDKCGNTAEKTFDVLVNRPTNFTLPKDTLLTCDSGVDPTVTGSPALDVDGDGKGDIPIGENTCGFTSKYTDLILIAGCGGGTKLLRKWQVYDVCRSQGALASANQIIEVRDNKAPEITCPVGGGLGTLKNPYILSTSTSDCRATLNTLPRPKTKDNCDASVIPEIIEIVNAYNSSTTYNVNDAELAEGKYYASFRATDACGNQSSACKVYFDVKPKSTPIAICTDQLNASFSNGGANIRAIDLDGGSTDNCGNFSLSIKKEGGKWEDKITYTCADVKNKVKVYLRVLSENGGENTCWTRISDGGHICGPPNDGATDNSSTSSSAEVAFDSSNVARLKGVVYTLDQKPLPGVSIYAKSTKYEQAAVTTTNGTFELTLPKNIAYEIAAHKNTGMANGVSILDLILILRHILGIAPFQTPYQFIAANANLSGDITVFDALQFRKMILDSDNAEVAAIPSWRFVDKRFIFDAANSGLLPFDEKASIDLFTENTADIVFIAIKMGDINGNVRPDGLLSAAPRNTTGSVSISIKDQTVKEGEIISVPLQIEKVSDVLGIQFAIQTADLDIIAVTEGLANTNHYRQVERNKLAICWDQISPQKSDAAHFIQLALKANKAGKLSDFIQLDKEGIAAEAYNQAEEALAVQVVFSEATTNSTLSLDLLPNSPNPFTAETSIPFMLSQAQTVYLEVYDLQGRQLLQIAHRATKGYNEILLQEKDIKGAGVLLYQLRTENAVMTGKMVLER